jgi:hypothetical protein
VAGLFFDKSLATRSANRGDRRAKAEYLLTVEARGELDLEVHMQAVLYSITPGLIGAG